MKFSSCFFRRCQTIEAARADAEKIRKIGSAEAHAIELVGKAEAERMRMKAHVYKQYGDAAIMNIVLESLPKVSNIVELVPNTIYLNLSGLILLC